MNVWRFDARIFDACRDVPLSKRGEYELPEAVGLAVTRGVKFRAVPASGAVLDLSRRSDVALVNARLDRPGSATMIREQSAITDHFISLGMTPEDAAARAALFAALDAKAAPILDGPAQWKRFTPGRIEMFGKHTDYAGGHSLLAAVPRGIALSARPRADGLVRVGDIFDGQVIEVDPSTEAPAHYRGIQRYVARGGASLSCQLSRVRSRRQHRDCERPAARLRHEQLERADRRHRARLDQARRSSRASRMAKSFAAHARCGVVPGVCREWAGLSGTAGIGGRRHARRQRGSHGDSRLPDRSRQPLPLRAGHPARRHAACRRTGRS